MPTVASRRQFLLSTVTIAFGMNFWGLATAADSSPPLVIADRACLFLDERFVADQQGLSRTWHQGEPVSEVMLEATEPWEDWPHLFGSVLFDPQEKLYKMWYQVLNPRVKLDATEGSGRYFVCYAESTDGKRWGKPKLGLVSFLGNTDNNIFRPEEAELPNVFLDPQERDPKKRFKMLIWLRPGGHLLFASGDGRQWTKLGDGVPPYGLTPIEERPVRSDTNLVIWDSLGQRYLSAYRTYPKHEFGFSKNGHRRGVGFTVSDRLTEGWGTIKTSIRTGDVDDARVASMSPSQEKFKNWSEPYIMPPFVYGNHYLGLVSMLDYINGSDFAAGGGALELAFSHDGLNWNRPTPATSAIKRKPDDEMFPCYAAVQPPLVIDNRLWHFYSEANCAHPAKPVAKSRIRAATWRVDGFASLATSGDQPGSLTTTPIVCPGGKLLLNAVISKGGSIRVEAIDKAGRTIPGYSADETQPLSGDSLEFIVRWKDQPGFQQLRDQPIQLRLTFLNARLYALRFSDFRSHAITP